MKHFLFLLLFSGILYSCSDSSSDGPDIPVTAIDSVEISFENFAKPATEATGKTYYVSQSGSDAAAGTESAPLKTLDKAWEKIKPGDVVIVTGKVMFDRMQNLFGKNGTATAPITIKGVNATLTRSTAFNQSHSNELIYFTGNYINWVDLEISDFSQRKGEHAYPAFRAVNSNNCVWERINYHHNAAAFSLKGNSSSNLFLNCDFSHNQDPYSSSPYDGADGLDLHDLSGTNNTVRGCRAFWNSDDGYDFWDNNGYVLIEDSWSFYNGYIPGTFNAAGNGSGIKLGSTTNQANKLLRTVKNNFVFKNRSYGIVENAAICKSDILNNTVSNSGEIGLWFGSWGTNVATFRGNISYKTPQPTRFSQYENHSGNSWNLSYSMKDADFQSMVETELTAKRKTDGSLPDLVLLKPKAGTPIAELGYKHKGDGAGPIEPPIDTSYTIIKTWVYNTGGTTGVSMGNKPNAKKRLVYAQELTIRKDSSVVSIKVVRYK